MKDFQDPKEVFAQALLDVAESNENIVALSADSSGGSGLGLFKQRFPERHIEFGLMEQGVIGFASGLATAGKIPFVAAIAPFVSLRAFEMCRNDLGYMNQNVKVVGRSAGLTYPTQGLTHFALEDVAIMRTIPNMTVIAPGDPAELKWLVHAAAASVGPTYIRYGGHKMPVLHAEDFTFEIGKGILMKDGSDVTIVGSGILLPNACAASEILEHKGIKVRLIDIHTIKPMDRDIIVKAAKETGKVVTVEEHSVTGGLGSSVAEILAEEYPVQIKRIGVRERCDWTGPYEELLGFHGLTAEQIAATVIEFIA